MKKLQIRTDLPDHITEAFKDLYVRLGLYPVVERLRQEVLTTAEVNLLEKVGAGENGPPADVAAAVIRAVVEERHVSPERALIDLALSADLLPVGRYESFRKAIDEPVSNRHKQIPVWNDSAGELRLNGELVREVVPRAKNVRLILNAFQEDGWPIRVDSPLPGGRNSRALREAVRNLKDRITRIEFFCDGKGEGVRWQHAD
jgi:hypothetical protein